MAHRPALSGFTTVMSWVRALLRGPRSAARAADGRRGLRSDSQATSQSLQGTDRHARIRPLSFSACEGEIGIGRHLHFPRIEAALAGAAIASAAVVTGSDALLQGGIEDRLPEFDSQRLVTLADGNGEGHIAQIVRCPYSMTPCLWCQ